MSFLEVLRDFYALSRKRCLAKEIQSTQLKFALAASVATTIFFGSISVRVRKNNPTLISVLGVNWRR